MMAQPEQPGYSKPPSTSSQSELKQEGFEHTKSLMRQTLREQRKSLLEATRLDFDTQITQHFMANLEIKKGMRIALYSSFGTEVGTRGLDRFLRASGVDVYYPRIRKAECSLDFVLVNDPSRDLLSGHLNILEPRGVAFDTALLDMVVLPGLAFDSSGGRLGQGQGCFDRALTKYKGLCVGLAYSCQIVDSVPVLEHDRKVDVLISEQGMTWANPLDARRPGGTSGE